jgi:sodium/bile acid cotransporter 7
MVYGMSSGVDLGFDWMLGLYTIACVPTTLSSGIVIAAQAGGNKSLAVMLTMVMSFLGVLILPFTLSWLLQAYGNTSIDSLSLMMSLCYKVLFPFLLGYVCQQFIWRGHRFGTVLPSSIVILIVYYSSSRSQDLMLSSTLLEITLAIVISTGLHLVLIGLDYLYVKVMEIKAENMISFVICGSQKTLPLSVAVLAGFSLETGQALVFCICFHFSQLILDSILAMYLKDRVRFVSKI